jgi:hypothetical protein
MRGAVTVLAINISRSATRTIMLPLSAERYTLQAAGLNGATVQLNGKMLALTDEDGLPHLAARTTAAGAVRLAPETITFLVVPGAANPACR